MICWATHFNALSDARYGFAAGCEAAALPRRLGAPYTLGYALGPKIKGKARTPGIARTQVDKLAAGQSHRLTSGGEAESGIAYDF